MIEKLFEELAALEQVEAVALGGSRAGKVFDETSDYDVYVYINEPISEDLRRSILSRYCSYLEIGNQYWEYEDNCVLNNGVDIDILYRNLDDFCRDVSDVVEKFHARNGYTTCMWHNLLTCKILYDKENRLENAKKRFSVPYPEKLRENIIRRNANLLYDAMPAYYHQIKKAVGRDDRVSIAHRTTAFLESYFDIIFAVNRLTHPGEKRLMEYCKRNCEILPCNFEANLNKMFDDMFSRTDELMTDLMTMVDELKKTLPV